MNTVCKNAWEIFLQEEPYACLLFVVLDDRSIQKQMSLMDNMYTNRASQSTPLLLENILLKDQSEKGIKAMSCYELN